MGDKRREQRVLRRQGTHGQIGLGSREEATGVGGTWTERKEGEKPRTNLFGKCNNKIQFSEN